MIETGYSTLRRWDDKWQQAQVSWWIVRRVEICQARLEVLNKSSSPRSVVEESQVKVARVWVHSNNRMRKWGGHQRFVAIDRPSTFLIPPDYLMTEPCRHG